MKKAMLFLATLGWLIVGVAFAQSGNGAASEQRGDAGNAPGTVGTSGVGGPAGLGGTGSASPAMPSPTNPGGVPSHGGDAAAGRHPDTGTDSRGGASK